ncbi:hypothetical protein D9619_011031 [Psilocybe cf. subviscida]|uniref:Nephrocystin 3-like N-terminal domain-containing protein n=1 Tax=Psilocybe cf. subviscida TaxID=2480587 RepID=A0A8H5B815_9AGAR|nr:hypothetical protein D9619_011031 [Psilocybe cf. subviscida]
MPNHMFTDASIGTITGGTFINHSERSALDKLSVAAAHGALHDAPARTDESRCHPHTRTNLLDHLERWAQGICDERASIFWLHGGAGAGKSAIMQTLAERCFGQGLALGSFFFSRNDPTRNTAEVLIPTLVYQIAQLLPSAIRVLEPAIDHNPLIFKKSLHIQLINLFVPVLQCLVQLHIINNTPQTPRVFLIDGLDECNEPVQQMAIIQAVLTVCHKHLFPVKFLIASRPEHTISTAFRWLKEENCILGAISLSEDPDADADIYHFIQAKFLKIRTLHPFKDMIPCEWPDIYDINKLVWKSSSHFIFASTTMKYIWSAKENPVRSLQVVQDLQVSRTEPPFSELDALYHHILGSAAHLDKVLQILAHCAFASLPSWISIICIILECSREDFFIFMADMTPLVAFSQSSLQDLKHEEVKLLHASLEDFLRNPSRSGSLHIDEGAYLASKLDRCFQLLNLYSQQLSTTPNWPIHHKSSYTSGVPYFMLFAQIIMTIEKSGHLVTTQELLRRNNLRDVYQCQLRYVRHHYPNVTHVLSHLGSFLEAVLLTEMSERVSLYGDYSQDFFDILELYISPESMPLDPAILPLISLSYPSRAIHNILSYHRRDSPSFGVLDSIFVDDPSGFVSIVEIASISHINISPERFAVAAGAILDYLFDDVEPHRSSTYSTHSSWLHQTKPGKHIAMGASRLASGSHAQRLHSWRRRILRLPGMPLTTRMKSMMQMWKEQLRMVGNLLQALLWVLPKAGFLEKIVSYSNRSFPQSIYQRNIGVFRRVRKCLDAYTSRVQIAKLEELGQRIENGGYFV